MAEHTPKSRAQEILEHNLSSPPQLSPNMAKVVSQYRRDGLENELNEGLFSESSNFNPGANTRKRKEHAEGSLGVVARTKGIKKIADGGGSNAGPFGGGTSTNGGSGGWRGAGGTVRQGPELYSPLWLNSNLNLPRDRATVNAWSRSFFALNPIVHNAITLHSTYPIAKLNIKVHGNPEIESFFSDMCQELNLVNICSQIAQEYYTLGEAFPYAELDESTGKWSNITILNPDYVNVQRGAIVGNPIISLRPDENLKRLINSKRPADLQQLQQLPPAIIEHVKRGENIPLNNLYVSHLARRIAPYEVRGTSIIVPSFRQLMLFDKFREAKFAQADNMVNPTTLIKIGNEEFRPTPTDIEQWRQLFESAQYDKDFKIITHQAVAIERVGWAQGIYDISGDITQLIKEIYIGLMVPSVIMDGADTTYATGSVALDVLRQRYMQFRSYLAEWLRTKIFAPIAKINNFYETKNGKKYLIVPEIDWNHMSLFDMADYIQNLVNLNNSDVKKVSMQTVYRSLGLDYDDEQRKIRYEAIQEAITVKEQAALGQMGLNDLRALQPNSTINEPIGTEEDLLPGEEASDGGGDGGGGGGGGGEMPDIGGLDIPSPPGKSAPQRPVGRPKGLAPAPPGGGSGIGTGGVPKPV